MVADIAWLDEVGAGDVALVGGKGANLGELRRAGFAVPDGFVVTTAAYARTGDDGAVEPGLAAAIVAACQKLVGDTGAAVAVRSSATAEDLADASFAGQQESYLGITAADTLLRAVADCWASLDSDRARAYRAHQGVDEAGVRLAVVVQLMIDARSSGVLFTANPVNGHLEQTVITAAWGLGEAVVSGLVDPDEIIVDTRAGLVFGRVPGDKAVEVRPSGGTTDVCPVDEERRNADVLTDEDARELAAIGAAIEEHFGSPQDIEWARDAAGFHIVQARPITALAERVDEVDGEWPVEPKNMYFRASIVEQLPDPLTPLFADLADLAVTDGLRGLMRDLVDLVGGDVEAAENLDLSFPTINGYAYYRYSNAAMATFLRVTPGAMRLMFSRRGAAMLFDRWRDDQLPKYREAVALWRGEDAAAASSARLLGAVRALLHAGCYYYTAVQTIIPMAATAEVAWNVAHATLAGTPKASPEVYLLGFDTTPIRAEKALWDVSQWCLRDAALTAALTDPATDALGDRPAGVTPAVWEQWRGRLDEYLAEFGHTTYNLDFVNPVPADDPAPVLRSIRMALAGDAKDPHARQAALAERRERETDALLRRLDPVRRKYARAALARAQELAPAREDALAAMGLAWPVMRRFLGELGARVAAAGVIAVPGDVYWLREDELARLAERLDAAEPTPDDLRGSVEERKARWRGQARLHPPQALPRSRAMSLMDPVMPARQGQTGPVLKGNVGSGGVVTGVARVVSSPDQFADFLPGEILVAPITTPAYTPLFAAAAGVVTDVGGVLSHGSIVAREYGIPAVLGTGTATSRIRTGEVITVDGAVGRVILGDGEAPPARAVPKWVGWAVAGAAVVGVIVWRRRSRRTPA